MQGQCRTERGRARHTWSCMLNHGGAPLSISTTTHVMAHTSAGGPSPPLPPSAMSPHSNASGDM